MCLFRQNHFVDDMDHAIAGRNISLHDVRIVHHHTIVHCLDLDAAPLRRLGGVELHCIARHHFTWDYVISEHALQLGLVFRFQQIFECAGG